MEGVRFDGPAGAAAPAAATSPSSCEMASLGRSGATAGRGTAGGPSALRSNGWGSSVLALGSFTCAPKLLPCCPLELQHSTNLMQHPGK